MDTVGQICLPWLGGTGILALAMAWLKIYANSFTYNHAILVNNLPSNIDLQEGLALLKFEMMKYLGK